MVLVDALVWGAGVGLDAKNRDPELAAEAGVLLAVLDLALEAGIAVPGLPVVLRVGVGALYLEAGIVELVNDLLEALSSHASAGLVVAGDHIVHDVDVIDADLLDEAKVVGPVEPVGTDTRADSYHDLKLAILGLWRSAETTTSLMPVSF